LQENRYSGVLVRFKENGYFGARVCFGAQFEFRPVKLGDMLDIKVFRPTKPSYNLSNQSSLRIRLKLVF
jgi:hypothetical protein